MQPYKGNNGFDCHILGVTSMRHCILLCMCTEVNFIKILWDNFLYESALHSFSLVTFWLCNFLAQKYWCKNIGSKILVQKANVKCCWNWHLNISKNNLSIYFFRLWDAHAHVPGQGSSILSHIFQFVYAFPVDELLKTGVN